MTGEQVPLRCGPGSRLDFTWYFQGILKGWRDDSREIHSRSSACGRERTSTTD